MNTSRAGPLSKMLKRRRYARVVRGMIAAAALTATMRLDARW
jgi:hypothetical protein